MSKQVIVKQVSSGLYFVDGKGFTGNLSSATRLSAEDGQCTIKCAGKMGVSSVIEEVQGKSFAVVYIRKDDITTATSVSKKAGAPSANQFDPSKRRFGSFKEAQMHAARFPFRRASKNDARDSGTAGHKGAFVIETTDPVNASVNPDTGKTNAV